MKAWNLENHRLFSKYALIMVVATWWLTCNKFEEQKRKLTNAVRSHRRPRQLSSFWCWSAKTVTEKKFVSISVIIPCFLLTTPITNDRPTPTVDDNRRLQWLPTPPIEARYASLFLAFGYTWRIFRNRVLLYRTLFRNIRSPQFNYSPVVLL